MNALSQSRRLHTQLSAQFAAGQPLPPEAFEPVISHLLALDTNLQALDRAIQSACDVHGALTMVSQMMDAAYDQQLNADGLRCLIDPLREKLGKALEQMRAIL